MSVVDRVLEALNAHDVEAFVACYAPEATIEDGRDRVAARGHDELRARYGPMFESLPDVHVEGAWRTVVGDFVVQEELVTGRGEPQRHVAVYQVENDLIVRERLIA
ncbi:MAG: nuclear transport factor 2 family protein [Gaiellaceae bacterium]